MPVILWPLLSLFAGWFASDVYNEYETTKQASATTVTNAVSKNWIKWVVMAVAAGLLLFILFKILKLLKIKTSKK